MPFFAALQSYRQMNISTLQSRASAVHIPPHRTQLHPRMHSSSSSSSQARRSSLQCWGLASFLFIVPFFCYLLALARGVHTSSSFSQSKPKGFGVVLHAAPTWTRIRVFEFLNEGPRIPSVGLSDGSSVSASTKLRPGLAELGADGAARAVTGLLDFARERIPISQRKQTKVWLMATGDLEDAVLESCRRVLVSSGFLFRSEWASLVSGEEEGLYAWVAVNFMLGALGAGPQKTIGIIELGGTSAQVTFAASEPPVEFSHSIKVSGVAYNLYSRSMSHFGQDSVWELLLKRQNSMFLASRTDMEKCIPRGHNSSDSNGIMRNQSLQKLAVANAFGNFSECRSVTLSLLKSLQGKCLRPPCRVMDSFLPHLQGKPFDAKNFFYTSEFFGIVPKASLLEIETAGRKFCEGDWTRLKDEYHDIDQIDLLRYCFSSAFLVAFLHDGLGISMNDTRVGFANHVKSASIDWTLGAFIKKMMEEPESGLDDMVHIIGDDTVTYLSLFAILCLVIIAAFVISILRKPQLKTVYDLEKGRYIVTRVPR